MKARVFYRAFRLYVRVLLRVFFREVSVTGLERLPAKGPVILIGNHVNGPLDPLLLLAATERRLTLTAKVGLRAHPLLGFLLRGLEAVLFHRREGRDEAGADANVAALDRCAEVLGEGGAVVLFPEGRSHSEARLLPFKTGAARLALRVLAAGRVPVVVPFGLVYREKARARTDVRVTLGPAIDVEACLAAVGDADPAQALTTAFATAVERAVAAGAFPPPAPVRARELVRDALRVVDSLVLGAPLFAFGALNHLLPAAVIASVERRVATDLDHHAPGRFFAGMAIYPLFYALQTAAVAVACGPAWGALYLALLTLTGLYALAYADHLRSGWARLRALSSRGSRRSRALVASS